MACRREEHAAGIVYIQYTNPAGYPPLEHSSRILAQEGWSVLFLGAGAQGADTLQLAPHPGVEVRCLPHFGKGMLRKLNYLSYVVWVLAVCLVRRPRWIYASDMLAALPALVVRSLMACRVVYHEHDSPDGPEAQNRVLSLLRQARNGLGRSADVCVLPQAQRMAAFLAETGRQGPTSCVWNCPRIDEIAPPRVASGPERPLNFYYHGSLNRERLPLAVLDALAEASPSATLTVIGYETVGSVGYLDELRDRGAVLALGDRVRLLGALSRSQLMPYARQADVGLSLMPMQACDQNLASMIGASNKPFDYLASGMALLVTDLPEWRDLYVAPGYALACDPREVHSLKRAMAWCCDNPDRVRAMGEAGRQRIAKDWTYERQFAEVKRHLAAQTAADPLPAPA